MIELLPLEAITQGQIALSGMQKNMCQIAKIDQVIALPVTRVEDNPISQADLTVDMLMLDPTQMNEKKGCDLTNEEISEAILQAYEGKVLN